MMTWPFRLKRLRSIVPRRFLALPYASYRQAEKAEWEFYLNYLEEGMIAFDVGACVGELTFLFSKFVGPKGQVHAFEATQRSFHRLEALSDTLRLKNSMLNHVALFDKATKVNIRVYDDESAGFNTIADRPLRDYGIPVNPVCTEEVQATTVDDYCTTAGIQKIDLLKIDVEGAEYQVLLGARKMLQSKKVRCCVFEFGQTTYDMGNNPDHIESYLHDVGYRIKNLFASDPVFPGRETGAIYHYSMHKAVPKR